MIIPILTISIILQFLAALLFIRLIWITGKSWAWIFIALALILMGIRRSVTLFHLLTGKTSITPDMTAELVALFISVLMVLGVVFITPIFRKIQSTNRDLTQNKKQLDEAQSIAKVATFELDLLNNRLWWSDEMYLRYNLTPSKFNPDFDQLLQYTHPDDKDRLQTAIDSTIETGRVTDLEYREIRVPENVSYVHIILYPVLDVTGDVVSLKGVSQDITDRRVIEYREIGLGKILDRSLNEIYIFDADSLKFIDVNEGARSNLGYSMEEMKEMTPLDLKPEFSEIQFKQLIQPLADDTEKIIIFETKHKRKDGTLYPVEVHLQLLPYQSNPAYVAIIIDVSERKRAEAELRESEERFRCAFDQSVIPMALVDTSGNLLKVNDAIANLLGYTKEELVRTGWRKLIHPDELEEANLRFERLAMGSVKDYSTEARYLTKHGNTLWVMITLSVVESSSGGSKYFIAMFQDITKARQLSEELSYYASHDALTGLINRRQFERHLDKVLRITKNNYSEHAMCFIDLDQFKVVNDTYGHAAGDELLRQVSRELLLLIRKQDVLARLGGDEFGVLLENCSLSQATRVINNLQETVSQFQFVWENRVFKINASFGLVPITADIPNISELLKWADAACYLAKDKGRNRIHVYHPEDTEIAKRHGEMLWVSRLQQALDEELFCLYSQPILSVDEGKDGKIHYELLLRLIGEDGAVVTPDAFLPAAERYDLISKIDRWVINNAFRQLSEHETFLESLDFCSINLSGQSLIEPDFLDYIIQELELHGMEPGKVCFEITETAAITNLRAAAEFINKLGGLGCKFALDDFGSGLSSFGYLKNLKVDYLKIDGMFVKDIADDPIDRAMVKSINEIGQVMGMKTIAEFVETDEIKQILREIGIDYIQGYGVGKPEPFAEKLSEIKATAASADN